MAGLSWSWTLSGSIGLRMIGLMLAAACRQAVHGCGEMAKEGRRSVL